MQVTNAHGPTQAQVAKLIERAKALGYDTRLLEFPATGS